MRLKLISISLIAYALVLSLVAPALAQEGEARVIDEVVAQVDNDVITLSMVKREMKEAITSLQQEGKSATEAANQINSRQPEIIASLINEQLLLHKGKELGLNEEVESEVNARMLAVAKQQSIKTLDELRKVMKESGFDYDTVRQTMRTELMKQAVLSRDVDAKIFYGLSEKELKDYFESHKDKFKKPESLTLSEIFLSLAGKSEAEVKAKADQLIAQARGGADFAQLAVANSERLGQDGKPVAPQTKGLVGAFQLPDLRDNILEAVKNVKAGGVTEPIRSDEGYQILHVDERVPGSDAPVFNENRIRETITSERADKARVEYMDRLRKDAYIKVAESYRAAVMPFLNTSSTAPATSSNGTQAPAASAEKRSEKSGNKPKK
ncbi:MAG: peptidyl-prolyl cis-trans isomerase [Acidobacteria bacterium]|nr:peptidyl-prolyl cis-trans isomerase [Acidobacteriota bacterium]